MGSDSRPNQSAHTDRLSEAGLELWAAAVNLGKSILQDPAGAPSIAELKSSPDTRQRFIARVLWHTYELCFIASAQHIGVPMSRLDSVDWWQASETGLGPRPQACVSHQAERCFQRSGPASTERVRFIDYAMAYPALLAQSAELANQILGQESAATTPPVSPRRNRGAFYTPLALIDHMLQSAVIEPLDRRLGEVNSIGDSQLNFTQRAQIIRNFRVCDPSVGVGGFLIRAAHHLASRHPDPNSLTDLIAECLYGVDIDPLAVTLCRAVLWLETPKHPCDWGTLCRHIKVGNALIGTTPELIAEGIPNEAFREGPGDSPSVVRYFRDRNRKERLTMRRDLVPTLPKLAADAWCAAFVWRRHDTDRPGLISGCPGRWDAITQRTFEQIQQSPHEVASWMLDEIERLTAEHRFFHWHLEFPEVLPGFIMD